jgi:hypothetical protein
MNEGSGRRRPGLRIPAPPAARSDTRCRLSARPARGRRNGGRRNGRDRGLLVVTPGVAAACWVVAAREVTGMGMGTATRLWSFGFFDRRVGGDDAARYGPGSAQGAPRPAAGAHSASVHRVVPDRLGTGRGGGVRAVPAARVLGRRRGRDRGGCLRALPSSGASAGLPRGCRLGTGVRGLRRFEHRGSWRCW